MQRYHHYVEIKMGCGCGVENRIDLAEVLEPEGGSAIAAMLVTLEMPEVADLLVTDVHKHRGGEKIDVAIRTKLGTVTEWADANS